MAKPSTIPAWISDANMADATKVATPPSAKRDLGYTETEKPPAQFLNWGLGWIYRWLNWLDRVESGAETLTKLVAGVLQTTSPAVAHAEYTRYISAAEGQPRYGSGLANAWILIGDAVVGNGFHWESPGDGSVRDLMFPLTVKAGDTIVRVKGRVKGGAGSCNMKVWRMDNAGTATQLGTTQTSSGAGDQDLDTGVLNELSTGTQRFYYVTFSSDTTSTDSRVYGLSVGIGRSP